MVNGVHVKGTTIDLGLTGTYHLSELMKTGCVKPWVHIPLEAEQLFNGPSLIIPVVYTQ